MLIWVAYYFEHIEILCSLCWFELLTKRTYGFISQALVLVLSMITGLFPVFINSRAKDRDIHKLLIVSKWKFRRFIFYNNPTQCLLRHSQAYKNVQKAEPSRCLALRTRGSILWPPYCNVHFTDMNTLRWLLYLHVLVHQLLQPWKQEDGLHVHVYTTKRSLIVLVLWPPIYTCSNLLNHIIRD